MQKCPEAVQLEDSEHAQLLLDNLDGATFEEVNE
jgi:hypothetical protein